MLYSNATRIVNNMYTRFQAVMTSIIRKLAWAYDNDPTLYVPVIKEIPGVTQIPVVYSQAEKVGKFNEFVYKITPYSTQRMSPETKYSRLMQFMTSWVLPTMQFAMQQGAEVDVVTATKILADYAGLENFQNIFRSAIPTELPGIGYTMQSTKSPGQGNDSFGALAGSREANLNQQQSREGRGEETGLAGAPKE